MDYKRIYPEFDVRICGSITAESFGRMYAACHDLDQQHTATYAIRAANMLGGELVWIKEGDTWISFAGAMFLTSKLDSARSMGRLRKPDGSTSYRDAMAGGGGSEGAAPREGAAPWAARMQGAMNAMSEHAMTEDEYRRSLAPKVDQDQGAAPTP